MIASTVNTITAHDQIVASIEVNGRTIASIARAGFSGIDEVVRALKRLAGTALGLARLHIRNKTRGWNVLMALTTRRSENSIKTSYQPQLANPTMRQYSIQWP